MSINAGKYKKKEGYFLFATFRMEVLADPQAVCNGS